MSNHRNRECGAEIQNLGVEDYYNCTLKWGSLALGSEADTVRRGKVRGVWLNDVVAGSWETGNKIRH